MTFFLALASQLFRFRDTEKVLSSRNSDRYNADTGMMSDRAEET